MSKEEKQYTVVQKHIKYRFSNISLLLLALTHKSSIDTDEKKSSLSNERLEFLGDAVLNCLITEHLYKRFPDYTEGQMSKMKSLLVSRKILAMIAKSLNLGESIVMGHCEKKTGGPFRISMLANVYEALLGAIYLDSNLKSARSFLEHSLFDHIDQFVNDECNINFKSKILELSQQDGFGIPTYPVISEDGPDHAKTFTVGIDIAGIRLGQGVGSCKKIAQQNAAYNAIQIYAKEYILSRIKGESYK